VKIPKPSMLSGVTSAKTDDDERDPENEHEQTILDEEEEEVKICWVGVGRRGMGGKERIRGCHTFY